MPIEIDLREIVGPLAKAILKAFLGPDAAEIGGTLTTLALKAFGNSAKAKSAEQAARSLAMDIVIELQPWFARELRDSTELDFYVAELIDAIDRGFSQKTVIESCLEATRTIRALLALHPRKVRNGGGWLQVVGHPHEWSA